MIDSGASERLASVEKFDGQRYIRAVDDHCTESWAKFRMWQGLGQHKILGRVLES